MPRDVEIPSLDLCFDCLLGLTTAVRLSPRQSVAYAIEPPNEYFCARIVDIAGQSLSVRICQISPLDGAG